MSILRTCVRLLIVGLTVFGCSSPEHASPEGPAAVEPSEIRERQIETLETIAVLEAEAKKLAESHADIRSARIYIRSGSAIVLLTAEAGQKIQVETIEAVNRYLAENAGLTRQQIIMKQIAGERESR